MRGEDLNRWAALDGVRGLAVLIVFFSHASDRGMAPAAWLRVNGIGHVGVYLFFVLSGFLLTRILLDGQSVGPYFVRRFFRIAPLYFLVLLGVFAYQKAGYFNSDYLFITRGPAALLEHFAFLKGDGIFWTIPTEFAFYLLLPLFVWIGLRWGLWVLAVFAVFSFLWFAAIQFGGLPLPPLNPLDLPHPTLFIDVFLCGVLAAFLIERQIPPLLASAVFALTMIVLLVCVSHDFLWFHQPAVGLRWVSLGFGISFAVLILAVVQGHKQLSRVFSNPVLRFVGIVGFGWYLLHFAVLGLVNWSPIQNPQIKLLIATLGTALVAGVAYWFVERPGIELGRRLTARRRAGQQAVEGRGDVAGSAPAAAENLIAARHAEDGRRHSML